MSEGIGKALASAIKEDRPAATERATGNIFANQHRREIFSQLTITPCLGAAELAAMIGITANSVGWHLNSLVKSGYAVKLKAGRMTAFYPEGLISREEAGLFCVINRPGHALYLRQVIKQPGLSQSDIAATLGGGRQRSARILSDLIATGTISAVSEGAHVRHYPTRFLPERAEGFYQHSRDFGEYILKRLSRESGAAPVVVKRGLDRMVVELGNASARFAVEIGTNPYITCISC